MCRVHCNLAITDELSAGNKHLSDKLIILCCISSSMKARRFSRLNNRIVRDDFSSGEEDPEPPKPFHMLLAEKSLHGSQTFGDLSLLKLIP